MLLNNPSNRFTKKESASNIKFNKDFEWSNEESEFMGKVSLIL